MKLIYEASVHLAHVPHLQYQNPMTYQEGGKGKIRAMLNFFEDHGVGWRPEAEVYDADAIPEVAGRLCYMSFDKPRPGGNKAYLDRIKTEGHGSVIEHANVGMIFTGVSRSLTHELVRHRAGMAYSQLSQRYVDESVAEYVVPPEMRKEVEVAESEVVSLIDRKPDLNFSEAAKWILEDGAHYDDLEAHGLRWIRSVAVSTESYVGLVNYLYDRIARKAYDDEHGNTVASVIPVPTVEQWIAGQKQDVKTTFRKAARGAARSVLPNATETKIMVTANTRAWRHFLEMRGNKAADIEIRNLAVKVYDVLVELAPNVFGDYEKRPLPDGSFELFTATRKV